jgi:hypothetical protein
MAKMYCNGFFNDAINEIEGILRFILQSNFKLGLNSKT